MKKVWDWKRSVWIPAGVARYAAGPDRYLREERVGCDKCGELFALESSDSDGSICGRCYDEAGEENARLNEARG